MTPFETEQEAFWHGDFGNHYVDRNRGDKLIAANLAFLCKVISRTQTLNTIIEFGSNIGLNLIALKQLLPDAKLSAVEINQKAATELKKALPAVDLHQTSILTFQANKTWDLVLTRGVLIHIHPDKLPAVYDLMYQCAARYVLVAEYYNPEPVEIVYRGHTNKLYKRDFAGEMLARFPNLRLIDYGFLYRHDPNFPGEDSNWFLMEKRPTNC
ncbi:pseudaminic acid biosynthesis-associated methylase [Rhodoferax sp. 4810]|uniref:Pseudaminic acid biosynthesis-associated methylase n=1 Tax=Thiospirillum jenense TaxID=1653858 RepID=A0A839HIZ3_9GAMM|nr:pseudaminic acid biosynthesis-associated methylase [Thiospirillum jenense]MBB1073514.1 pseudaminic acid biosynthesis-associated methylase [Rhodoferax jenense]MBB1126002.1 pseudaminic acid biosynthesis-associated methylase [Thiospirillum jenense]